MTEPLVASLLGHPRFAVAANPVTCASKKALGLFVFLLLTRKSRSRRELAALFWGQRDESGRASLRAALHRLPPEMVRCLRVDRESLELAVPAALVVDVERFEALANADDLESLELGATLYQDELLKDFEADATPEFDDWLHAERVRLGQVAQKVFERVLTQRAQRARNDAARATGERECALATGLRWVSLMPGAEAAHRWLMRIYIDMGRKDAALAQYELCRRLLAVNHGRAPSPETRQLHEAALGSGEAATAERARIDSPRESTDPGHWLDRTAVPATSFLGRLEELAELDRLLGEPACRLVTLHGMGGAGKTRLAHALAAQVARRFLHGVTWVGLEGTPSPASLPAVIAQAIGREVPPQGARAETISAMLAGQQRLLVLDNFESLLTTRDTAEHDEPVDVVLRILQAAPQVRIVITSREVLGVQEEWVYEVAGLACASEAGAPSGTVAPGVELFADRARQAYLGFSLPAEMPHVLRICSLVEGLPLGIELAAAWVRTVPCGEIAAAIEREAAALRSTHRNRPGRHRSLEAVVAYSWNLLRDEQRNALAALGVFVGGFSREAAEQVAEAPLRTLSILVDKALIRRMAEGRYDMHELVRQFALARLQQRQTRRTVVTKRHADFFADLLLATFADMRGPAEVVATARFRTELPNLLAGWRHSIAHGRLDVAERIAAPLIALLHTRAMLPIALAEAERAIGALEKTSRRDIVASVRMQWGRVAVTGGKPDVARRELDAALSVARHAGKPDIIARCIYYRASLAYQQGDLVAADEAAEEVLALAGRSTDPELRCLAHNLRGTLANMRSRFDVAESHLRLGLAAAREQGAPSLIATMLCSAAVPLYYRGEFAEAASLTKEAATIFEALGRTSTATMVRGNLAALMLVQGDLAGAQAEAELAVRLSRESGDDNELSGALNTLGDILLQQGQLKRARTAVEESLRVGSAVGFALSVTEAHYLMASIEVSDAHLDLALAHLVSLRDLLAQTRLSVRIPMLILGAAGWAAATGEDSDRRLAYRWLRSLGGQEGIDTTLRDKARALLPRIPGPAHDNEADSAGLALDELEREVFAFLEERA